MRRLLNTLFITTEDAYAALDGENVTIKRAEEVTARFPLHTLEAIISFSYAGASPALMGACAEKNVSLTFCTPNGRFLARSCGKSKGNVLLRKAQYRFSDSEEKSCEIAKCFLFGKVYNSRKSLERTLRDHSMRVNTEKFTSASTTLKQLLPGILEASTLEELRGLEGTAASNYFSCLDEMILSDKKNFFFGGRNRRPPLDRMNAILSFTYTLLGSNCASALETTGLDAYVGFLHRDRPGRTSLALDLMEELRPCFADRFSLSLINNRIITANDFTFQENGAVLLNDDARRTVLQHWQKRKSEIILHPYLDEKMPWGLVPYAQALLLARYLRGDLDAYPPFLWR